MQHTCVRAPYACLLLRCVHVRAGRSMARTMSMDSPAAGGLSSGLPPPPPPSQDLSLIREHCVLRHVASYGTAASMDLSTPSSTGAGSAHSGAMPMDRDSSMMSHCSTMGTVSTMSTMGTSTLGRDTTMGHLSTLGRDTTMDHLTTLGRDTTMDHLSTLGRDTTMDHLGTLGRDTTMDHLGTLGHNSTLGHHGSAVDTWLTGGD